jgi:hypothetical protein
MLGFMRASSAALREGDVDRAVSIAERIDDPYERKIQTSLVRYQTLAISPDMLPLEPVFIALAKSDIERAYGVAETLTNPPMSLLAQATVFEQVLAVPVLSWTK